ncbi:MAG: CocE/NonD family hydrolase [Hyphomicrobiales bacterium]
MKRRTVLFLIALLVLAMALIAATRLADHDLSARQSEPFAFSSGDNELDGTLWLPDVPMEAAIVLVHGDGPADRLAGDALALFINAMLNAGIAVASWDKPGIGGSTGEWLSQSMEDRAVETAAALQALQDRLPNAQVGALGFSQAGWVVPKLTAEDADFLVLVGPAVSWQQQGDYYTRTRLERSGLGLSPAEIEAALAVETERDERLFGPNAIYDRAALTDEMSEARWGFVQRNRLVDAGPDLRQLSLPLLAVWGANDLNVDAQHDAAAYEAALADRQEATRLHVVPDATHGLLKAGPYNYQLPSHWSWIAKLRFIWEGREAYAPGALGLITDWIAAR